MQNSKYADTNIIAAYFFSLAYKAGAINFINSYNTNGEATKKPKYNEMVIWFTNWLDISVVIKFMLFSNKLLESKKGENKFLIKLNVTKSPLHGANTRLNNVSL